MTIEHTCAAEQRGGIAISAFPLADIQKRSGVDVINSRGLNGVALRDQAAGISGQVRNAAGRIGKPDRDSCRSLWSNGSLGSGGAVAPGSAPLGRWVRRGRGPALQRASRIFGPDALWAGSPSRSFGSLGSGGAGRSLRSGSARMSLGPSDPGGYLVPLNLVKTCATNGCRTYDGDGPS